MLVGWGVESFLEGESRGVYCSGRRRRRGRRGRGGSLLESRRWKDGGLSGKERRAQQRRVEGGPFLGRQRGFEGEKMYQVQGPRASMSIFGQEEGKKEDGSRKEEVSIEDSEEVRRFPSPPSRRVFFPFFLVLAFQHCSR